MHVNILDCLRIRKNSVSKYIFQLLLVLLYFYSFVGKTWGFLADMLISTRNKSIYYIQVILFDN